MFNRKLTDGSLELWVILEFYDTYLIVWLHLLLFVPKYICMVILAHGYMFCESRFGICWFPPVQKTDNEWNHGDSLLMTLKLLPFVPECGETHAGTSAVHDETGEAQDILEYFEVLCWQWYQLSFGLYRIKNRIWRLILSCICLRHCPCDQGPALDM